MQYQARTLLNEDVVLALDPRVFYEMNDNSLPVVSGSNDEKALKALKWVRDNIVYTSDTSQFKHSEEWLFAHETIKIRTGDCEDGAILIANIMLKSGVPSFRIRLNAGSVEGGGHCWVTYLRESDNQWIILDWCYWYNPNGNLYHDAEKYYSIWFSWNTQYIFPDESFDRLDKGSKSPIIPKSTGKKTKKR